MKLKSSDILLKKNKLHLYSVLWNVVIVCFVAIKLVIVLAWFLWRTASRYQSRHLDVHPRSDSTKLAEFRMPASCMILYRKLVAIAFVNKFTTYSYRSVFM